VREDIKSWSNNQQGRDRYIENKKKVACKELKQIRNTRNFGTYLFNGICSNGPEVGIVPHKSLLETSLKIKGMFRLFESTHIHVMLTNIY